MFVIALFVFAAGAATSLATTAGMRVIAPRLGLCDHPGPRKVHERITPLGGGVAIWLAVVAPLAAAHGLVVVLGDAAVASLPGMAALQPHVAGLLAQLPRVWEILAIGSMFMAIGLWDDRQGVSWRLRLVLQCSLAAVLVARGVRITLIPPFNHPAAGGALTVLWIVGLANSFNLLDNMDALSGGVAWISCALFAILMAMLGEWFVAFFFTLLAGALSGFLWFNWPPASIFMGDAGSNFVGFMIGALTVVCTFARPDLPSVTLLAPLCILAVPVYDTASVVWIRLLQGRSPFQPDRNHFSHRLVDIGFSRRGAVLLIYLVTLASGLDAFLLYSVRGWGVMMVLAQLICMLALIALLEFSVRRRNGHNGRSDA